MEETFRIELRGQVMHAGPGKLPQVCQRLLPNRLIPIIQQQIVLPDQIGKIRSILVSHSTNAGCFPAQLAPGVIDSRVEPIVGLPETLSWRCRLRQESERPRTL